MNSASSNSGSNSLFAIPGKNCFLSFFKNSSKNKELKLITLSLLLWSSALDVENIRSSGTSGFLNEVIPLNPRIHPVKLLVVIPVYVIISSLIFKRP